MAVTKEKPRKKKVLNIPVLKERTKLLHFIKPMLAKETKIPFDDKEWIYEIKWDGYRAIAEIENGKVKLYSRNGLSFLNAYPIVAHELQKIKVTAVLDGEIIVVDEKGNPNFQLLQYYGSNSQYPIYYYVFDILYLNKKNVCDLPLVERKKLLYEIVKKNKIVRYSDHIKEHGIAFFEVAKKKKLEGIMAKKADSLYYAGKRTSEWLKIKHHSTQEVIITGFTEPTGSRQYFGALVLGILEKNKLKYAGHTGSGFNQKILKDVYQKLKPIIQKHSPFEEKVKTNMPVTWVKPILVCEVKFSEITRDGIMRHPIFMHLREDKPVKEVTMESTKTVTKEEVEQTNDKVLKFGKIEVKISNYNKVFWPDKGITKGDVVEYYQSIADYILPYLKGRPQSLKRNPNGILDEGFFHKDVGGEAPPWVKSIKLFSESANKEIDYILCDNEATLAYMNNLGCIEINPWHSTIKSLDKPDYLMIDIDPSPKNSFEQVIEAANVIKNILDKAGAISLCKTSGATGLHVYVPTQKKYTYDQVKDFAHLICMLTTQQLPEFASIERSLKKRGNKIYMDYLQNRRGQTIACAYSLRPRPEATVSTPLKWKEVKSGLSPLEFDILTVPKRLKKTGDLFSTALGKGIDMHKCLKQLNVK